jgi:hypothetical protein
MIRRIHFRVMALTVAHFLFWFLVMPAMVSAASTAVVVSAGLLMLAIFPASYFFLFPLKAKRNA